MAKKASYKLHKINPEENPFEFIFHPYVTEKTMNLMERLNRLEFVVARAATKQQIKIAFEKLYNAKVDKINTRILKDGKHAIIKLKSGYSAEEIGMRIGIF
jgi:large subunit ribosomal protein L23